MHSHSDRRMAIHPILRAMILIGIAVYVAYLHTSGYLSLYIAPRMALYVKLGALALYVLAVAQLYEAYRLWIEARTPDCGCEQPSRRPIMKQVMTYSLFIVPLIAAFASPSTMIGSVMAANKGFTLSAAEALRLPEGSVTQAAIATAVVVTEDNSGSGQVPTETDGAGSTISSSNDLNYGKPANPLDALFPADEYTQSYANLGKKLYQQDGITVEEKGYMETLTAVDLYLDRFIGKELTLEGFVYRDGTLTDDQFILGRFTLQCCAADAMPYGVMIESSDGMNYENDTWLRMTGTISRTSYHGNDVVLLEASEMEQIEPAQDPYVYPNYDF
ncbi:putative repeat protein (TIGR03943 family) [Paenibacillus phyllosphaerae]|uniref:Putative repeat protein (TIGR03943 family) n=1 Tax=Paenibacillus phyllosphaerae TaxID=274593 RepID=A0A7W5AYL7_9BACL|nr:TIGR03943 family protein [Paenibacillus phyllosphaerae]MBB3111128.1 putative repeat protein (TIGR03943 family) [Paenibacillus phyllosphaerae]